MCIMLTDAKPTATRVFLVPVTVHGVPHTCMLYTNDLQVSPGVAGLMIVPFPNPGAATRFGLVDVTSTKEFRQHTEATLRDTGDFLDGMMERHTLQYAATNKAAVHDVGNYRCSVVPSLEALRGTIDWDRFVRPTDLEARLSVLQDTSIVPPHSGFIVAQAIKSVAKDGFGVVFPGHHAFFPTCHEGNSSVHDYDVVCYGFNMVLPKGKLESNQGLLKTLHAAFRPTVIWSHDGSPMPIAATETFHLGAAMALKGPMTNANIKGLYCSVIGGTDMTAPQPVPKSKVGGPVGGPAGGPAWAGAWGGAPWTAPAAAPAHTPGWHTPAPALELRSFALGAVPGYTIGTGFAPAYASGPPAPAPAAFAPVPVPLPPSPFMPPPTATAQGFHSYLDAVWSS
jgi:hypothetical protein